MHQTLRLLQSSGGFPSIHRRPLETLQVNLGYRCNQSCVHCHVNAGPARTEQMDPNTIDTVVRFLAAGSVKRLDVTGGAPELHPQFRSLASPRTALRSSRRYPATRRPSSIDSEAAAFTKPASARSRH